MQRRKIAENTKKIVKRYRCGKSLSQRERDVLILTIGLSGMGLDEFTSWSHNTSSPAIDALAERVSRITVREAEEALKACRLKVDAEMPKAGPREMVSLEEFEDDE